MFKILDFKRRHKKKGYRNGCPPTIYLLWYLASAHFTSKSFKSFHWLEKLPQNLFGKLEPKKRCVKKLHLTNRLLTMVSFGLLHLQRRSESRLFEKKFHYVLIDTWVTVLYGEYVINIARYSPVVYTKKFVQLMLRFYWLRSPWQWTDVFQYSPSSRKLVALFVNIDQREKWNPL